MQVQILTGSSFECIGHCFENVERTERLVASRYVKREASVRLANWESWRSRSCLLGQLSPFPLNALLGRQKGGEIHM